MRLFLKKMKVFLSRLYTIYAVIIFLMTCVIFLLPQLIMAQRITWHHAAVRINYYWAWTFFRLLFVPIRIHFPEGFDKKQQYILCANHFSYLDIPTMPLLGIPFKFIGKSSVARVPIFGYMFKKIHVMVNRESVRSRANSMKRAQEALIQGFNMCFFPEGGIKAIHPPEMVTFRDGAFRLSTELKYSILPVVLHTNYRLLPDDGNLSLRYHTIHIDVLPPIPPTGDDEEAVKNLRDQTYKTIQDRLNQVNQTA